MNFIEANDLSFSALNETIRGAGKECRICGCLGQRFIAAGMSGKKLEINEKLRELDELHRMVDGIPPEILQAAKQVAAHKQQER